MMNEELHLLRQVRFRFLNMNRTLSTYVLLLLTMVMAQGQFAPAANEPGTTAIHKDSSIIVSWAEECDVVRGYIKISDTTFTYEGDNKSSLGDPLNATGKADGKVVSLGDGGYAIISLNTPLENREGPDFAIFENGFQAQEPPQHYFLELAFVEVSSDGQTFVRFPATSNVPTTSQTGTFAQTNPTLIYNLAGKYTANYGTPFNLDDLNDSAAVDVNDINYIKIIDVVGSVDPKYAGRDAAGNIINDPWPTPFASGGFDLDAVGFIHAQKNLQTSSQNIQSKRVSIYPNPATKGQAVTIFNGSSDANAPAEVEIFGLTGKKLYYAIEENTGNRFSIRLAEESPEGIYLVRIKTNNGIQTTKLVIAE